MKNIPRSVKERYDILGVIGEGSYGVVLKARKKDTNTTVAIKHFKQNPGYCTDMDVIERELKILQSLRFENVVELIEWFREKKQCFLVFEYVEWNMLQVLQEHPDGLTIEQVRQLSHQLFSAIHWCHSHEIIHRDIKPENLLISKNFILKLCDFGFARFCNTQTSADYYTDYVATRWYRSPELLIGSPYGKPVDIWACGCIIAELATGQALFAGESDIDQLYRIQKCLGPLPPKYMEAMKSNPKFEGLKFPPITHLDTLERRYGQLFPQDLMNLFKGTLRLFAPERLTAESCLQHEAFAFITQKQQKRLQQRQQQQQQQRPKTVLGSMNTSQISNDHSNETVQFSIPFVDSRLTKWHEENTEAQVRRRSPTIPTNNNTIDSSTDLSYAASSSILTQQRYRNHAQITDRSMTSYHRRNNNNHHQSKFVRAQSRTHSSSSDERTQVAAISQLSSNDTSDDDDDNPNSLLSQHSRLRRKYVKTHQGTPPPPPSLSRQHSLREQTLPSTSPTLRYASNGVLLRPKQQINVNNTSKEMGKKLKRFTFDTAENRWHPHPQVVPESNIHRPSMAIVPSLNANISSSLKQYQEINEQRSKTRDLMRSRTVECHPTNVPSVETSPMLQRTQSRQTLHYQVTYDPMDQADGDTTISTTHSISRSPEQQQQNMNKYFWNFEQRKANYSTDGHHSSLGRLFNSPSKADYNHVNKIVIVPQRESNHDLIKSAKTIVKQNPTSFPKTPTEINRRQQSIPTNLFGVYPYARTAILHVANVLVPTSRQQSIRLPSTKSRHHDR